MTQPTTPVPTQPKPPAPQPKPEEKLKEKEINRADDQLEEEEGEQLEEEGKAEQEEENGMKKEIRKSAIFLIFSALIFDTLRLLLTFVAMGWLAVLFAGFIYWVWLVEVKKVLTNRELFWAAFGKLIPFVGAVYIWTAMVGYLLFIKTNKKLSNAVGIVSVKGKVGTVTGALKKLSPQRIAQRGRALKRLAKSRFK